VINEQLVSQKEFFMLIIRLSKKKKPLTFSLLFGVSRLIDAVERKGFGAKIFNDGAGV
jgi:hypothetical protein